MISLERLRQSPTLSSFRRPGYVWLWSALTVNGMTNAAAAVTFGWLALELTGTPVAVGTLFAVRNTPRLLFAVPLGALSDRRDRRRMLQGVNLLGALMALGAAGLAATGSLTFGLLLVVAFLEGSFDAAETTIGRAFIYDLVGRDEAVNGMALEQLGNRSVGAAGSMAAGVLLAAYGSVGPFVLMFFGLFAAAAVLSPIRVARRRAPVSAAPGAEPGSSVADTGTEAGGLRETLMTALSGFAVLWHNPVILLIAGIGAAAEVFAFSSDVLLPSFARDVLQAGETGLGNLVAMRHIGGVAALLLLASLSRRVRPGKLILWVCCLFSVALIVFANSSWYPLSLALMLAIGVAWASVDVLLPKLIQDRVPDEERGAAVGVWNLSRGAGPLGSVETGALAAAVGAPLAQIVNAAVFLSITLGAAMLQRTRRWRISGSYDNDR